MKKNFRIILDGMGGDNAPSAVCDGAVSALKKIKGEILIVGDKKKIEACLGHDYDEKRITIVHAPDQIETGEAPLKAIRTKKNSSLVAGLNLLKEGGGDVMISAGNTGAILAGGIFILGRIAGVDRPALASVYPVFGENRAGLLVDAGANSVVKAHNLLEFATMGSIYAEKVLGTERPLVGLVNMGTEPEKGPQTLKEAHTLLTRSMKELGAINFAGNVEARDLPRGICDVVVTDGLVGNVIIKLTEGLGTHLLRQIKQMFTSNLPAKIGAVFLANQLRKMQAETDYSSYGGAPILGVKKPLIKTHGSSSAETIKNAVIKSVEFVKQDAIKTIEGAMVEIEKFEIVE